MGLPREDLGAEVAALLLLEEADQHGVVEIVEAFRDQRINVSYYLVMPFYEGRDLFDVVNGACGGKGLPEDQARSYFISIVNSLLYMKTQARLAHGDVRTRHESDDKWEGGAACDILSTSCLLPHVSPNPNLTPSP